MKQKRVSKYFVIGISLAIFNFTLYTIIARIINNNDFLWLSTLISTFFTAILAFILHSKITWKEKNPGKSGIIKFIIYNVVLAFAIGPFFTWVFKFFTPLYQLGFDFSSFLHLPFDYNFIESTGVFFFVAITTMLINFLFYDRFVFNDSKN